VGTQPVRDRDAKSGLAVWAPEEGRHTGNHRSDDRSLRRVRDHSLAYGSHARIAG
jgi:hypothetical protein